MTAKDKRYVAWRTVARCPANCVKAAAGHLDGAEIEKTSHLKSLQKVNSSLRQFNIDVKNDSVDEQTKTTSNHLYVYAIHIKVNKFMYKTR